MNRRDRSVVALLVLALVVIGGVLAIPRPAEAPRPDPTPDPTPPAAVTYSEGVVGSASSRILKVQTLPLASEVHDSARSGWYVVPAPSLTSPENTRPTSVRSARLRAVTGVTDEAEPTTPSR